jgi:hypothetical protein
MSRTTKIGLWSVPWFPAFLVGLAIYASQHPTYESWTRFRLNPNGTTTIEHGPPSAVQLPFDSALRVVCWASVAAFLIGVTLLLVSLARVILRRRTSYV